MTSTVWDLHSSHSTVVLFSFVLFFGLKPVSVKQDGLNLICFQINRMNWILVQPHPVRKLKPIMGVFMEGHNGWKTLYSSSQERGLGVRHWRFLKPAPPFEVKWNQTWKLMTKKTVWTRYTVTPAQWYHLRRGKKLLVLFTAWSPQ